MYIELLIVLFAGILFILFLIAGLIAAVLSIINALKDIIGGNKWANLVKKKEKEARDTL